MLITYITAPHGLRQRGIICAWFELTAPSLMLNTHESVWAVPGTLSN